MLAALACVDCVVIFNDDTPHRLLELVRPYVFVKGGTTAAVAGREIVEGYAGRVVLTLPYRAFRPRRDWLDWPRHFAGAGRCDWLRAETGQCRFHLATPRYGRGPPSQAPVNVRA